MLLSRPGGISYFAIRGKARLFGVGGADGIRTHYLLTASQTLSQLSYSPVVQEYNRTAWETQVEAIRQGS
jgi:hypothetical protein